MLATERIFQRIPEKPPITKTEITQLVSSFPAIQEIIDQTHSTLSVQANNRIVCLTAQTKDLQWLTFKLRDRTADGPAWKPTTLDTWNYNSITDIPIGNAVEQSSYWLDPRYPLTDMYTYDQAQFIKSPYSSLQKANDSQSLMRWIKTWEKLFEGNPPYPGYFSRKHIPHFTDYISKHSLPLLLHHGYTYLSSVPSYYHVAKRREHSGFAYCFPQDKKILTQLSDRLVSLNLPSYQHESWLVFVQYWIQKARVFGLNIHSFIPSSYVLNYENGEQLLYPLSPDRNLWMHLPLSKHF